MRRPNLDLWSHYMWSACRSVILLGIGLWQMGVPDITARAAALPHAAIDRFIFYREQPVQFSAEF